MARIDLHKLAVVIGFEVVCVDDEYTNYEYMMRLRDIESISYIIKIKYNNKTKYSLLREYGNAVGVNIEEHGCYFTYKISKKTYAKIISLIESKLPIEKALKVGKIKDIEYKISYIKQNISEEE